MHEPSTGASPQGPLCNVTIPVFNRPAATERAIRALAATSREVPFHITVVDNGSEPELVKKLLALRAEGLIDHLFLLPRNMGVACAANVGWQLVPAPLYMKLDNDTAIVRKHWLRDLLALWSHGQPLSNLGGAFNREMLRKTPGSLQTPHGGWIEVSALTPVHLRVHGPQAVQRASRAAAAEARPVMRFVRLLTGW